MALIAASGTIGEWQNWILFRHGGNFGVKDPQFRKDVGFYVFKLPFLNFVVDWTLAILIVTLVVSLVFHYLNGGILPQRGIPRVRPPVKAHLSVLLALIALDKAAGYILQRWWLVNAQDGYVNGAGYTDVHARLPALLLLVVVSIFAAAILLFNIRRQGWTLPVLAVGIWAFVALVVGVIYPALLQALKVTPAQSSLEAPYIQRNITATRAAYGLNNVQVHQFPATTTITASQTRGEPRPPSTTSGCGTPTRPSPCRPSSGSRRSGPTTRSRPSAWTATPLTGRCTPVLIGVREINRSNLPRSRGSTRTCSTPTATGPSWPWPTRPTRTTRSTASRTCRRHRRRACPGSPSPTSTSACGETGLRGGQHQAARGGLPEAGRHERREPLHGHRRACSCRRSSTGPRSPCAWATSTC